MGLSGSACQKSPPPMGGNASSPSRLVVNSRVRIFFRVEQNEQ